MSDQIQMSEAEIIDLLRLHGISVNIGNRHSIKCQFAQVVNLVRLMSDAVSKMADHLSESTLFLKEDVEATGGCDHDTGLCCCGLISAIERNEDLLARIQVDLPAVIKK